MRITLLFSSFLLAILLGACSPESDAPEQPVVEADLVIAGGTILDGSGSEPFVGDVAISGERIVYVGEQGRATFQAAETIDASGLWVTPGFIDAHSHAELDQDYGRDGIPYLYQGITTVVLGLDGGGTHEVAGRLAAWDRNGIGVNGLHFVGHGHVREEIMGREDREPTAEDLE